MHKIYVVFLFLFSFSVFAQNESERRYLVVYSFDESHPELSMQKDILLSQKDEFVDRKIALLWVDSKRQITPLFNAPVNYGRLSQVFNQFQSSENSDFQLLLIGLDGGVKYRSNSHVPADELMRLIDAMPMRRQEIKNQNE